jgi:hypothetical protein
MKKTKTIAILLIVAISLTIAGCSGESPKQDTPSRIGTQGIISGSFENYYTFNDAIEQADLIVDLTIIEWIGESTEKENRTIGEQTYFSAKINNTIKGKEYDTIVLTQHGNSEWTYTDDPLYRIGDRLFLFLKEMPYEEHRVANAPYEKEYENAFYSVGTYRTAFSIWEYNEKAYLLSRFDWGIAQSIAGDMSIEKADSNTMESIVKSYTGHDQLIGELIATEKMDNALGYAFSYDDVVKRISDITKKEEFGAVAK